MSRSDLVRTLGPPPLWISSDIEAEAVRRGMSVAGWLLSPLLRYGGMEFHFPDDPAGLCWMIFTDNLPALRQTSAGMLQVSPGWLSEGLPEAAVCARLSAARLAFAREPFPPAVRQIRLRLASGVRLGLTDEDDFFDVPGQGQRLFCVEVPLSSSPL